MINPLDISANFKRHRRTAERQIRVAGDDGQQVIEIVRDAAGQTADRLHFAGLLKLRFKLLPLRDIDHDPFHYGMRIAALYDHCRIIQPDLPTVLAA